MKPRRIIVTGGAGFIGSHLARRALDDGHQVTVVDDLSTGRRENVPAGAEFLRLDLGEEGRLVELERIEADAVFHLAGQSSGETSFADPLRDLKSHIMSSFHVLDWCRRTGCSRFIYSSSMAVYGDPDRVPVDESHPLRPKTYYGAAKVGAEAYIRLHQQLGVDTTIFRLFSVYGPGQDLANKEQGMVSIFYSYMLEGAPILVKGSAERFRDFTYVGDVVDAWMSALDAPATFGNTYNLATGKGTTVAELLAALKQAMGRPGHPVEFALGTPGDQFGIAGDASAIEADIGWRASTDLVDGLAAMVAHERARNARSDGADA